MTEPEKVPERRVRDVVRPPMNEVGRIRLGSSINRPATPPAKIERWCLTSPPSDRVVAERRFNCPVCGAHEGPKHLSTHPFWRRVVAALARYAR